MKRIGLLAAALALTACHEQAPRAGTPAAAARPRLVQTAAVSEAAAESEVMAPATVQARQRAALAARIAAAVVALPFREGQPVAAGALVAQLDDTALRSAEGAAEAAARSAEADLARSQALEAKGAATPAEREQAEARAAGARAALAGARDQLAYAALRAPFAGTVAARPAHVGDVVSPGTTLLEIEGAAGFELLATLESGLAARMKPGLVFKAVIDGLPDAQSASIRTVSAAGDPATHRFEVRADLPDTPGLRSGLFARLVLPSAGAVKRLLAPTGAFFARGGLQGVFVVADGRARLRWVALGDTAAGSTEVRAGLLAGERVVLDPADLTDDAPVVEAH
jgi:RND family efflux transporter MFP subunit